MELPITVATYVFIMLILIIVGYLCIKTNIIKGDTPKQLTDLLLLIINPCIIINSFIRDFDKQLIINLLIAIGLAFAVFIFRIFFATLIVRKKSESYEVTKYSLIFTNCGFMALPIIAAIWGMDGTFYATAFILVYNIFNWSYAIVLYSGKFDKKELVKIFLNPNVIAIFIALIIFFFSIKVPFVIKESISLLAALNSPLAMIIVGTIIAQIPLKNLFSNKKIYFVSLFSLIIFPLISAVIYSFLPFDKTMLGSSLFAASCPVAITCSLFAVKYERNSHLASSYVAATTVLSIISIPLVFLVYSLLLA